MSAPVGIPPKSVTNILRLDGLAVAVAAIVAFAMTGASWWLFLLVLAPDLSFVAFALGTYRGAIVYNVVHSYAWPALLILAGLVPGLGWLTPLALVWAVHIGVDRAVGYGLKYPHAFETTHIGLIGRARKAAADANAG
jgi:hypothetical protein